MTETYTPWRTASYSANQGSCVEVRASVSCMAVRDSKDRGGPVLEFTATDWASFASGVRAGRFDR